MERTISDEILRIKLAEALATKPAILTRRDVRLPKITGKPLAIIGVRRGGKTSLLHQQRAVRVAEGRQYESQLLLGLEDERLSGITAVDLGWIIEEYTRQFPAIRRNRMLSLYLDEIQVVNGWESLVHRLVEARDVEIIVSGSSAKLLSREVATALRGRLMEVLVHPFSFRETLRHAHAESAVPWHLLDPTERAELDARLSTYLRTGGFPEAQDTDVRDRVKLLKGYVDTMVLRDVIERHKVSNTTALKALRQQLLSTPGGSFTVNKFYQALKSQGVPVAKDTLYAYLDHLQDAFLIRLVSMHSGSAREQMVNPRKVYPIDTGLIPIYGRPGFEHGGRALETAILLELERREYEVSWLRVGEDWEVDFFAAHSNGSLLLVQVCLDTTADATWEREIRALDAASKTYPTATAMLITHNSSPPTRQLPAGLQWNSAAQWLLSDW